MKYSRASEGRRGTYGVEMETVGMVMLNFKHRGKLAYFAEQKRLRLRERARRGERDANWEHVQKNICANGAGRQDYEGGEETLDDLGTEHGESEIERERDRNSSADKRITY